MLYSFDCCACGELFAKGARIVEFSNYYVVPKRFNDFFVECVESTSGHQADFAFYSHFPLPFICLLFYGPK